MRVRMLCVVMPVFTGTLLGLAAAGDDGKVLRLGKAVSGRLTTNDPQDKVLGKSYCKRYTFQALAGKSYKLELRGRDVTPVLRIESRAGEPLVLAEPDEDDGSARTVFQPKKTAAYHIIVTTAEAGQTGGFELSAALATPTEILLARISRFDDVPATEQKQIAVDFLKYLRGKDKIGSRDLQYAFQIGEAQESASVAQATETYRALAKILSGTGDVKFAKVGRMFEGAARRINLPGKRLEIKAVTLAGKPLDWKSYRGKIVLVDFWATWCPPCVNELPNVKKLYETYHKRGFDVLGISLDRDKGVLSQFLDRQKLPWTNILDNQEGNGLADYFGVFGIPLPILVDRNGRVLSMNARGANLERLLKEHIAADKK